MDDRVEVLNVNAPDHVTRLERVRFESVRDALLDALPIGPPGLSAAEIKIAISPQLETLFPGGAKLGWWLKSVQLDQEARGAVARVEGRPLRFHRTA